MSTRNLIVVFIVILLAGAAGFFAGTRFQGASFRSGNQTYFQNGTTPRGGMMNGRFGNENGARGGGRGQVVSINGDNITIKLNDGTTRLINLTGSTTYVKTTAASKSDIKEGDTVLIIGTPNSDGSLTAQEVQVGANLFGRPSPSTTP